MKAIINVKQYELDYLEIFESIDGEYLTSRQINKKIAKNWNVPYQVIKDLAIQSRNIDLYMEK
jgi:hypothetical protein